MSHYSQESPELTRLKRTNQELKDLQRSIKTGSIDVKVLMEFRSSIERARQASTAVQQWLETQKRGNDPYHLMPQVMSQRVEMATQLVKDVTHDIESGDVNFETAGLAELGRAVQALAERMKRLFPQ